MSGSGLGVGCKRVTQMPPPPRLQGGTHSGAWVQSLIRELGSHMLHSMVKKERKRQTDRKKIFNKIKKMICDKIKIPIKDK